MDEINDKNPSGQFGKTPLHRAVQNGDEPLCQMIISEVEDKNPHGQFGKTPLHVAAENGNCQFSK